MQELIPVLLSHPNDIPPFIENDFFDKDIAKKLKLIYEQYKKTGKMISNDLAKSVFNIEIKEPNEADLDYAYSKLEEWSIMQFLSKAVDKADWTEIETLQNKYKKTYGDKTEGVATIKDITDVNIIYQEFKQDTQEKIDCGFAQLNDVFDGGWSKGGLYSILGLSGYGKSIFLTNFACKSWFNNKNVLYITTEMNEKQTFDRIIREYTNMDTFERALFYLKTKKTLPSSIIQVRKVHPGDTTPDDIQNIIDKLEWKPDVIIIDYGDELRSPIKALTEYDGLGYVYSGLKKLAEVNSCPVITATQTNRSAENEKGGTKDWIGYSAIADSLKKVRLCDGLMSITQSPSENDNRIINLNVIKNRYGKNNIQISFAINYDTMRLTEAIITKQTPKTPPPEKKSTLNMMTTPQEFDERLKDDKVSQIIDSLKDYKGKK